MSSSNYFDKLVSGSDARIEEAAISENCFLRYCSKEDDGLTLQDFHSLLAELFTTDDGTESEPLPEDKLKQMFNVFDSDSDSKINKREFDQMWQTFIEPILRPKSALIIIDVQNDFIDGSLAIRNCPAGQEGVDVVPVINDLLNTVSFQAVFYTYDWHPEDHVSFVDNVHLRKFHGSSLVSQPEEAKVFDTVVFAGPPPTEQKLWPRHCVQKSWGSELHSDLKIVDDAIFIYKGSSPDIDSYSAFWDNQKRSQTELSRELKSRGITDVFICGLASDYCVGFTALHALEHGFRTILVEDACRGVSEDDINCMKQKLISQHAVVVTSADVLDIVTAKKRCWELGYFTAMLSK